jgi:TorA maturation chaperone TorD
MHSTALAPGGSALHSLDLPEEDQARADVYALLSYLFLAPPDASLLTSLAGQHAIEPTFNAGPLALAMHRIFAAANAVDSFAVREEFDALFVSTGTPLLNPYGSRYLCGFMNDAPLAALREDLARLGLARRPSAWETEDHLGVLCETMRMLIAGTADFPPQTLDMQKAFFERHLEPWVSRCLADISDAGPANFYRVLAELAAVFFEVEAEGFAFLETDSSASDALSLA